MIDMNDLDNALRGRYPISHMDELGFEHISTEMSTHYFVNHKQKFVVEWDSKNKEFWTYPRANHRKQVFPFSKTNKDVKE